MNARVPGGAAGRVAALTAAAETESVRRAEYKLAFVLMFSKIFYSDSRSAC